MLASIHRSLGRRAAGGAVALALALTLPLGAVAQAAPAATKASAPAKTDAPAPAPAGAKSAPAGAAAVPEPPPASAREPAAAPGLTVLLPLEVSGSLSKDSRRALANRLQAAAAAAKVTTGAYRLRLALRVAKNKKDFALTLTVLGSDDAEVTALSQECKACSIADVEAHVDALVQQAEAALAPKPAPPAPVAVAVSSEPAGARVRVDGADAGVTPVTIELLPGEHTVIVDKPGFLEHSQTLTVEPGVAPQVAVKLTAQPPEKRRRRAKGAKGSASPGASRGLMIGGGVLLGLGVAGIATGVAMILIDEDPIPQRCAGADVDFRGVCRYRYDTLLGGIVGTAAGAVGIGGGLAMMIKGRQIAVRARAGKQEASLGVIVRF